MIGFPVGKLFLRERFSMFFFSVLIEPTISPNATWHWKSFSIYLGHCDVSNREISPASELYIFTVPKCFDATAAYIHACLFVAFAFSAFFLCAHFCYGMPPTPHERMPLFYEIVNVESVRQFWPRRAITRRDTRLFVFQFLFKRKYPWCMVVRSSPKSLMPWFNLI